MTFRNRFKDRVAVVTGGAQGLGKAIAWRILEEGGSIVLCDRDAPLGQEVAASAQDAFFKDCVHFLPLDITNEASVESGFAEAHSRFGKLDILVNAAGIVGPNNVRITETPTEGFEEVLRVNLTGSFLVTKHILPFMQQADYGRVLLIASIAGKEGNAGMSSYSTSKAGVIGLVKSVGKEFAESNITVNGLAPAVIRTQMVEDMEPAQVEYMTSRIPMKRCGSIDEIANMVAFIASKEVRPSVLLFPFSTP